MQMEFEERHVIQVQDVKCHNHKSSSRHKFSKSDSDMTGREDKFGSSPNPVSSKLDMGGTKGYSDIKKKPLPGAEVQNSLKQEILQLEKRLLGQFKTRCALEKALGCSSSAVFSSNDTSMPKPAKELIREIALLELEVMYLEQYLLSLYRKAFSHQIPTLSAATGDRPTTPRSSNSEALQDAATLQVSSEKGSQEAQSDQINLARNSTTKTIYEVREINCQEKTSGPDAELSHSSLSHPITYSARISPSEESLARAIRSCHSQPLSFPKVEKSHVSRVVSLAEYLGTNVYDHIPEAPNKLSEDLVSCMCAIYCRLAEPPLVCRGPPSSPVSSSSVDVLSPKYPPTRHRPIYKIESILDSWLVNPFQVEEGLKEFSGPCTTSMVEVSLISREPWRLRAVEGMLQDYKSILRQLQTVDPKKMKHEEKLAFWINIHNALMMHAYVEYGIPQNYLKKTSLLIKANCTIGGRGINAATIQGSILFCRTHCPAQWLQSLLYPRFRNKPGDCWQGYAIDQQEPLLHFALATGSHSDPMVRVYTRKTVFQQLEAAKEEFIRARVRIWKEERILIPKVVHWYAKDIKLSSQALVDMVHHLLSEMSMQRFPRARPSRVIEWEAYNFNFQYLLSRELAL